MKRKVRKAVSYSKSYKSMVVHSIVSEGTIQKLMRRNFSVMTASGIISFLFLRSDEGHPGLRYARNCSQVV